MHPVSRHLWDELSATAIRILAYLGAIAVIGVTLWWIAEASIVEAGTLLAASEKTGAELPATAGRPCKLCAHNGVPTHHARDDVRPDWIGASRSPKLRGGVAAR